MDIHVAETVEFTSHLLYLFKMPELHNIHLWCLLKIKHLFFEPCTEIASEKLDTVDILLMHDA